MKNISVVLTFLMVQTVLLSAQSAPVPSVTVVEHNYLRYPSLNPVNAINVTLHDNGSGMTAAIEKAESDPSWNCLSPDFYTVAIVDKSLKILQTVPVKRIIPQGYDTLTKNSGYTNCDTYRDRTGNNYGNPGSVELILAHEVDNGSLIQVSLYYDKAKTKLLGKSDGTLTLKSSQSYSVSATPQAAPNESLTNGNNRDVGQLIITAADNNLLQHKLFSQLGASKWPLNAYVKSNDLFSTDENDAKSAFSALLGAQSGIFPRWYSPLYLEQGIQGNQTASNLSAVTNLGIKSSIPWIWSEGRLDNHVVALPLPPDVNLVGVYTYRINQLVTKKSPLLSKNDFTLNPSLSWKSITLPWSCTVLDWVNQYKGADQGKSCLGTEVDLGGWYLPNDTKVKTFEPYGDVSILLPLSGLNFASKLFPYITSGDPTKMQIRVKYAESVNAANNYAKSHQWTYGLEAMFAK
jgi:hypothetical protein